MLDSFQEHLGIVNRCSGIARCARADDVESRLEQYKAVVRFD